MYKIKELKLKNVFSFWKHFKDKETFLFYNPIEDECIMGAVKLKSFRSEEDFSGYKYIFSTRPFFENIKVGIWSGFGAENIAFSNYLKVESGRQTLYYGGDEPKIEDFELQDEHYEYVMENEDYENWIKLFNDCHSKILLKELSKVVISRVVKVNLSKRVNQECILKRLIDFGCFALLADLFLPPPIMLDHRHFHRPQLQHWLPLDAFVKPTQFHLIQFDAL